jgi:hypothetical protein
LEDEKKLKRYFQSGDVAEELAAYIEFFGGISALETTSDDTSIETDIMDYILENEHQEKTKYRSMWKMVTGIAASVIIVLASFLVYQEQQKPFDDTFNNPEEAYAYATKTLGFVSEKYGKGLAQLSSFEKLRKANEPVKKSTNKILDFYEGVEHMDKNEQAKYSETDSL